MREEFISSRYRTINIEGILERVNTLEEFEEAFPEQYIREDNLVGEYLLSLLEKYKKAASAVSLKAGYASGYLGKIINENKAPSRDALLAFSLVIGTTYEEAQTFLKYAGHSPLYCRRKRDVVIWFGFKKHMEIEEVDKNLFDRGLPLISKN